MNFINFAICSIIVAISSLRSITGSQQDITQRSLTVDDWLFSEDLFPGHEIPQNVHHSDAIKMFSTLLEDHNILSHAYDKYKFQHNKEVEDEVKVEIRKHNFKENLHYIFHHNLRADIGHFRFQLGVNTFADMSTDEMSNFLGATDKIPIHPEAMAGNPPIPSNHQQWNQSSHFSTSTTPFPHYFDLRDESVVSPVKNQKKCGSCVFFSMAGMLETMHALKNDGEIINVSEQMMLDCAIPERGYVNNGGCHGNTMEDSLQFLTDHGVCHEREYKYEAEQQTCALAEKSVVAKLENFWQVEPTVEGFKHTLVNLRTPIAAAYLVYRAFMFYRAGVYDSCSPPNAYIGGHAVLITGYGKFLNTEYWIVKNSWSPRWGEQGFFKYVAGSNFCQFERWGFAANLV